jgi:dTDP-4-dehydrorhamnose 3,5-epimerase
VKLVEVRAFDDPRGALAELFRRSALREAGIEFEAAQENESLSARAGTVRGLHFQAPPHAQAKLVRVARGAIYDVAVDVRAGSPAFGRWAAVTLEEGDRRQLYVPRGFAHGFCTLRPDTVVLYLLDAEYAAGHDKGLAWDDPALAIPWPVAAGDAVLSEKDRRQPRLAELPPYFRYEAGSGG